MICPQCGYSIKNKEELSCPRCAKRLVYFSDCSDCKCCHKTQKKEKWMPKVLSSFWQRQHFW